jgi:hypothetical protein
MTFTIRPATTGGWLAFVWGPRLLVVDPPDDFVDSAWAAIARDDGFQETLDLLTSKGLAATPSFVLVEWQHEDVRVIVRGTSLKLGAEIVSAAGVSTWVERTVAAGPLAFDVPDAAAHATAHLPLAAGVALVASVSGTPSAELPLVGAVRDSGAPEVASRANEPEHPDTLSAELSLVGASSAQSAPEVASRANEPEHPEPDSGETVREAPESAPATTPVDAFTPPPTPDGYDYLFGDTMFRGVAEAAVREPDPEDEGVDIPSVDGDHDGETVLTSDIAKLRGKRKPRAPRQPEKAQTLVLVVSLTGAREPLDQPLLVGRSPSVSKISSGRMPRLISVGSADQDISRTHAQFALEGGTVVVTDLHSRNGTSIVLPGKSPQKLRAGEPTSVIVGTVVDLGGGITLTVEEDLD